MAIKSPGYYSAALSRYVPAAPKVPAPKPVQYSGPTSFQTGYQPGAIPRSAGYQSYGGSTYALPGLDTSAVTGAGSTVAPGSAPGGAPGNAVLTRTTTTNPFVGDIASQPDYQAGAMRRQTSLDALRTALREANQNALIASGVGLDPSKLTGQAAQFGEDFTPAVLAAAAQNQFSTRAGIERSLNQGLTSLPYELARRSAGRSGAAITHAEDLNRQAEVQRNQLQNALLSQVTGNVTNYFGNVGGVEDAWAQTQRDIASRMAQLAAGRTQVTETWTNPATGETTDVPSLNPNQTVDLTPQGTPMINLPSASTPATMPWATNASLSAVNRAIAANRKRRIGP